MPRTLHVSLLAVATIFAGCGTQRSPQMASENGSSQVVSSRMTTASGVDAVVQAATSFEATLTPEQRDSLHSDLTIENASRWSNFPSPFGKRNGVRLGALTQAQQKAGLDLARLALSEAGFASFQGVRAADTFLGSKPSAGPGQGGPPNGQRGTPPAGAPPGGGAPGAGGGGRMPVTFDSSYYFIAFVGKPSTTGKWILQLGGHHYALNLSFGGAGVSPTPFHIGVEPRTFTLGGRSYAPMAERAKSVTALMRSLSSAQTASAHITGSFHDILLGPGSDFQFPQRQGVLVSSLTNAQRTLVINAIRTWVDDVNRETALRFMALYTAPSVLDSTYVAYATSQDLDTQGAYVRIDGPRAWVEISAQQSTLDKVHYHSVWRDKQLDYGGIFSSVGTHGVIGTP